jgi:hypothetical protein
MMAGMLTQLPLPLLPALITHSQEWQSVPGSVLPSRVVPA